MSSLFEAQLPTGAISGYLYVWCPSGDLKDRLNASLLRADINPIPTGQEGVLCYVGDDLSSVPERIGSDVSISEQKSLRVLYSRKSPPDLRDFARVKSLEQFCQEVSSRWLKDLLSERRLKSLMQPIVSAGASDRIIGYEFLLRGIQTDGSEIPAPVMFKAGGDAGMLYLLDIAAGEHASRTASTFGLSEKVFINVMPSTLADDDGLESFLKAVKEKNAIFSAGQLVVELVESEALSDADQLKRLIDTMHDNGVQLALDDFGTGFNNFSALSVAKPDYVKLDKSLQAGLIRDARRWHMVANVIDAAKQHDILVVAEGIEDEETAASLKSAGVDFLQGYLYGYPKDSPVGF